MEPGHSDFYVALTWFSSFKLNSEWTIWQIGLKPFDYIVFEAVQLFENVDEQLMI